MVADEDEKDETRERPKRGRENAKEEEEEEEKAQQSAEKHGNSEKASSDEDEEEEKVEWKVELRDEVEFAQWSVADVLDLLANRGEKVRLEFSVANPSVDLATAEAAAKLLQDAEKLKELLTNDSVLGVVEEWGELMGWWRLVKRALAFCGLFEHLEAERGAKSKKGKGKGGRPNKKRLEDMWNDLVKRVRGRMSFKHANDYAKIVKFLKEYPGFIYQAQFVTKDQWTRTFKDKSGERAKPFTVALKQLMDKDFKAFWKSKARLDQ